jgi:hypothetical protein
MIYFLLANLTESSWLTIGPNPNWMMVGLAVFAMSRQLIEQRLQAAHGDPQAAPTVTTAATDEPPQAPAARDLARRYRSRTRQRR